MPIFLLYGFFFYPQDIYRDMGGMMIFVGIFITGGVGMSVGNYFLGWESSFFDAILANNIDFDKYFRAKYMILLGNRSLLLCGYYPVCLFWMGDPVH